MPTSSFPPKTPVAECKIIPPNLTTPSQPHKLKPIACHSRGLQETIDHPQHPPPQQRKRSPPPLLVGNTSYLANSTLLHLTSHDNHNHRTKTPPAMPPPFIKTVPSSTGAAAFNTALWTYVWPRTLRRSLRFPRLLVPQFSGTSLIQRSTTMLLSPPSARRQLPKRCLRPRH